MGSGNPGNYASQLSAAEGRVNGAITVMAGFPPGTDAVELKSKIGFAAMPLYKVILKGAIPRLLAVYL